MLNPPREMKLYLLLKQLPGYTRRELESEPAQLVERWFILLQEEAREQAAQAQQLRAQRH